MEYTETIQADARQLLQNILEREGILSGKADIIYNSSLKPATRNKNVSVYRYFITPNFLFDNGLIFSYKEKSIPHPYNLYPFEVSGYEITINSEKAQKFLNKNLEHEEQITSFSSNHNFLVIIPDGGKYTVARRMAKHFSKKAIVPNYILASCITPTVQKKKFTKHIYVNKKSEYNDMIKNRLRILNKYLKKLNFTIKFNTHNCQRIQL